MFRCIGIDGVDITRSFPYREISVVEARPFLGLFHTRFALAMKGGVTVRFRSMDGAAFAEEIKKQVDKYREAE